MKKKVFEVYQTINGVSKANEGFWDSENFFGAPETTKTRLKVLKVAKGWAKVELMNDD